MTDLQTAARWLRHADEIVVFTGAGVSAESGIPTFRDDEGFWSQFPTEQFATWRGLVRTATLRPRRLAEFVHAVVGPIAAAQPNAAHLALADAERHAKLTLVTQNIDGLHQEAGSTIVRELHGSLLELVTLRGRFVSLISRAQLQQVADKAGRASRRFRNLPSFTLAMRRLIGLGRRGAYRPNLVLFGDALCEPAWSQSLEAAQQCDCLLQIGCSGVVLPAALLPREARTAGARIITVDPQQSSGDLWLPGRAGEVVPQLLQAAFA